MLKLVAVPFTWRSLSPAYRGLPATDGNVVEMNPRLLSRPREISGSEHSRLVQSVSGCHGR